MRAGFQVTTAELFDTEMAMMTSTLAEMKGVLGDKHPLSARGLYGQLEEPVFLVMEDLAPRGFRMASRQDGLDLSHCKMAINGLARFHAASIAVCEKVSKSTPREVAIESHRSLARSCEGALCRQVGRNYVGEFVRSQVRAKCTNWVVDEIVLDYACTWKSVQVK